MTMSIRTPPKGRPGELAKTKGRGRIVDTIPTIEEAKRRLAAAAGRDRPWLHLAPEFEVQMAEVEEAAGGWLVGPEVYQPSDAE
jgi:hypothetical protein